MKRFNSNVRWLGVWAGVLFAGAVLDSLLAPISLASAQERRTVCDSGVRDTYPGPVYCTYPETGLMGQLNMTSTTTATISVRQLEELSCSAFGYNDVGDVIGNMTVTVAEGSADKCFWTGDSCFDFSPIKKVRLWCEVPG